MFCPGPGVLQNTRWGNFHLRDNTFFNTNGEGELDFFELRESILPARAVRGSFNFNYMYASRFGDEANNSRKRFNF